MLGGDYTDAKGRTRPLRESDFMVVAPYNAQVRCLREALADPVGQPQDRRPMRDHDRRPADRAGGAAQHGHRGR
jgi:hypothetical protein